VIHHNHSGCRSADLFMGISSLAIETCRFRFLRGRTSFGWPSMRFASVALAVCKSCGV